MKKSIFFLAISGTIIFAACGSDATQNEHEGHEMTEVSSDTLQHAIAEDEAEIKAIAVTFKDVDGKVASSVKSIVDAYLLVKNALVADDASAASKAASGITSALKGIDKSLLTPDQKNVFDAAEAGLKSGASGLEKQSADISVQRTHFYELSKGVYELVKAFGAGRTLYHDHCPMAFDNKGALWISEMKDVKNPYFGADMLTCGTVEEVIN